jgi:ribulose-5-phosphate 4-epimerase/fuculose-1-phosphate aldolase
MAVSAAEGGLPPISRIASQSYGRLGVHEDEGVAPDLDERQRIVKDLRDHSGAILRNHGLPIVGRTAAEAFNSMFYFYRARAA